MSTKNCSLESTHAIGQETGDVRRASKQAERTIVTDGRKIVDARGSRNWNRPVEVHAAVKERPRQSDRISAREV